MTVDYSCYAIIGLRVQECELVINERTRGCSHPIHVGYEEPEFCSKCGQRIWIKEERKLVVGYDEDIETYMGYRVIWNPDHKFAYIAALHVAADEYEYKFKNHDNMGFLRLNQADLEALPKKIEDFKSKIPKILWGGNGRVGLWSCLHV